MSASAFAPWLSGHAALLAERSSSPVERAEAAIREVLVEYAVQFDGRCLDGVVGLFAADATVDAGGGSARGRGEIRALFGGFLDTLSWTAHTVSNVTVVIDSDDSARAAAYVQALTVGSASAAVQLMAMSYRDRLVRRHGRWLIAERRIVVGRSFDLAPSSRRGGVA